MKYFIDTEFLEGVQQERFLISLFRKNTPPTIDLISIGIVAEDGRGYYAISKDFNLKEAWNRFQMNDDYDCDGDLVKNVKKVYWLRENVLYPIYWHLYQKSYPAKSEEDFGNLGNFMGWKERKGTGMKEFEKLLNEYGKTNKEIAKEVKQFVYDLEVEKVGYTQHKSLRPSFDFLFPKVGLNINIEFYAYYADYDWVVFCWLFGKMIDLPKGFPMYCRDLKQMFDEKENSLKNKEGKIELVSEIIPEHECAMVATFDSIKEIGGYPQQTNEHDAFADACWNKKLYEFLNNL